MGDPFTFLEPGPLEDGELALTLATRQNAEESIWGVPAYIFHMRLLPGHQKLGRITLRAADSDWVVRYTGHVGYAVDEPFRGRGYAERGCRLLLPFVKRHGWAELWITCGPDNPASRRTLERLGAEWVETVDVPPDYPLAAGVVRQKCRYRLKL
ncbi:MAG TPA: GNAT family N-acetyltransferase [Tepidisphaeraceae bacterium]|jgi:predicted acetyltransferase